MVKKRKCGQAVKKRDAGGREKSQGVSKGSGQTGDGAIVMCGRW